MVWSALIAPTALADAASPGWLPREDRTPGGIALVDISSQYQPGTQALFNDHRVKIQHHGGRVVAVVGIPLSAPGDQVSLQLETSGDPAGKTRTSIPIKLHPASYPEEHMTIADNNKVSPDADSMRRIRRETGLINGYLRHWQTDHTGFGPMTLPVTGRHSSAFGQRRIINGQPRRPHSGMDIAAPTGTPIYAPATGIATGAGNFFFNGNSLFVDHGNGLVSMFCHLEKILASPGEPVSQGQLLGRVGSTGRVTGPHLHWSLSLNDARVDPLLFIENNSSSAADGSPGG